MRVWAFLIGVVAANETMIKPETYSQIVLKSMLQDDKPVSYCVDIPGCCGVGEVKTSSSLMMHTCKTPNYNPKWQLDEIWDFDQPSKGMIRWRASKNMCLKVSKETEGRRSGGKPIKLAKCDKNAIDQKFVHKADGTIRLRGLESMCWIVSQRYRKSHVNANNHMRSLYLSRCSLFLPSVKQFLVPPGALTDDQPVVVKGRFLRG